MGLPPETPELKVLELLVSVAETGSLGRAAARHGMSQPAASMRISALERRLRLVLLERSSTGSRLTPAGTAVVEWALPVLDAARALVSGVAALHADQQGRLRIAASMTIADHRVPGWLITLRARLPQVRVALRVGNSAQVTDMVRSREADLGFVEGPRAPDGLRSRTIAEDELVVVVAPGHPWARRRQPLPLRTLAATPLIVREQGSGTRDAVWEVLRRSAAHDPLASTDTAPPDSSLAGTPPPPAGRRPRSAVGSMVVGPRTCAEPAPPAAELGSTTAIKSAVSAGDAPAVLSRLAVSAELDDRRLISVPLEEPALLRRRFRAVWQRETPPTGPAATLLALVSGR
ncbi:LysR substrate-binding domain-containing protein [Streptomyces sp. NBC_00078]|uniref:LysR substrate-binding domain-containing protein n=1 Tax=unclassified Streptomyces TaxID=2593676 RepID=UPI00224E86DE|nr:LysR substrate-binding domain-containing protein [Streptomyces sp. NBC_00078]MCX5425547.1 LysR substrate-binding domain-containing protein [Streptomyces sp. NBC_00078]